jgi:transglutaminase-like putative cysteine protease
MKVLRLTLLLLVLAGCVSTTPGAPEPAAPAPRSWSFLITHTGSTIGWAKSTISEAELDGKKVWHEREEMFVQIRRSYDGQAFEIKGVTESWFDKDWKQIKETSVAINGPQTTRTEVAIGEDIRVSTQVDKNPAKITTLTPGDKPVFNTYQAWFKLKSGDLSAGTRLEFQNIDDDEHALVDEIWTVNGRSKRKLTGGKVVEGTEIGIVNSGHAATVVVGDDDQLLYYRTAVGFTFERTDKIPDPFKADLFAIESVMKANVEVADYHAIDAMEIEFAYEHDDGEGIPPIADTNTYHEVKKLEKGYALLLKSQRLSDKARELKFPLAEIDDSVKPFLKATPMCQSEDETLAGEAQRITKDIKTAASAARAIMRFVDRRLQGVSGDTGSASARQAYDEKQGDCTEHAALFVALARAAGLPARNVSGFVYLSGGGQALFGYHAWAEVWLGEWVPVDATVTELGTSARYVMMEYDEPGHMHGRGRSSRCVGQNIKPIVNTYNLQDGATWQRKGVKPHFGAAPEDK